MKKLSVWPMFAFLGLVMFISSCGMMWLSEYNSRMWDTPAIIAFISFFACIIMSTIAKREKATYTFRKYKSLRERKN